MSLKSLQSWAKDCGIANEIPRSTYVLKVREAVRIATSLKEENEHLKHLLEMAKCPDCDGSGGIPYQVSSREYITRSMALDACDPSLEGSLYSDNEWEQEQCQWCDERKKILGKINNEHSR